MIWLKSSPAIHSEAHCRARLGLSPGRNVCGGGSIAAAMPRLPPENCDVSRWALPAIPVNSRTPAGKRQTPPTREQGELTGRRPKSNRRLRGVGPVGYSHCPHAALVITDPLGPTAALRTSLPGKQWLGIRRWPRVDIPGQGHKKTGREIAWIETPAVVNHCWYYYPEARPV